MYHDATRPLVDLQLDVVERGDTPKGCCGSKAGLVPGTGLKALYHPPLTRVCFGDLERERRREDGQAGPADDI